MNNLIAGVIKYLPEIGCFSSEITDSNEAPRSNEIAFPSYEYERLNPQLPFISI